MAVVGQPDQWMMKPVGGSGCPPGLEYLSQIDQLLVHQQVDLLEAFTGWEQNNKYAVKNSLGQQVYFAAEETDACMRQCCEEDRAFLIHVLDNANQEVMRVQREFKCCGGCCWCASMNCASHVVTVEAPVGTIVGYVRQSQSCWSPKYTVTDASDNVVFTIDGPCCPCQTICCRGDIDFMVRSPNGNAEVGKISKQWAGLAKELFTKAANFGVTFPMDLDVKMKATLLGATFLIDFMYFEDNGNDD